MNIDTLKTELTDDPLARGYAGMDDQAAADDLNTAYRDSATSVSAMLQYLIENRSRTNNGTDTVASSMLGRLAVCADAAIAEDLFGSGTNAQQEHIHAAKMMLILVQSSQLESVNFAGTEFASMLNLLGSGPGNAKVWKQADSDALQALSQGIQTRATELGIGRVKVGHVAEARA